MIYMHRKQIAPNLIRHWSNESNTTEDIVPTYKIMQIETGLIYAEAIDVMPCKYTYKLTNEPIEDPSDTGVS